MSIEPGSLKDLKWGIAFGYVVGAGFYIAAFVIAWQLEGVRSLNLLTCLFGGVLGWNVGVLLSPRDPKEKGEFAEYGKAISAFVTGLVVAKLDVLFSAGELKALLADPVSTGRLLILGITFGCAFQFTFIYRRHPLWLSDEPKPEKQQDKVPVTVPVVLLMSLLISPFAFAQSAAPAPPQLTWVRYYASGDAADINRAPFEKLLAEKKIIGWGVLAPATHIGDPWTRIVFVSVADWAALDAVAGAFAADRVTLPSGVHDVVLRHVVQSATPPAAKPRYVVVNTHPITRGRDSDALALFNEWAKPVFLDLASKGKVGPWGLSAQNVVVDNEWTYMVWYFLSDLSALDDVNKALAGVAPSRLETYERRLREMSEDDYRGQLLRVVHMAP